MNKKYVVYEHVTPDGMYYFGQTQNVEKRWECNGIHYKRTSLQPYIEKYGWENIQHIVLFRDQTKEDALFIEDFLIETAQEDGVCINQRRSGNISKEEGYRQQRYQQNREKILEQQREYKDKNREKILEQHREYNEKNREKYNEYQREYREQNREKALEYQREYREKNREKNRQYQRQYRQRKKLEKQHKEVETTPLF